MTEGKRPGGLTALAVFNFIFSAYDCLQILGSVVLIVVLATYVPNRSAENDDTTNAEAQEENAAQSERSPQGPREAMAAEWRKSGLGIHVLYVKAACYLALAFLLIASGVGFLRQSRFWGRRLGSAYAVVSIGTTVFEVSQIPEGMGGFSILAILFIIYPVLVLILLNTTFREDFLT